MDDDRAEQGQQEGRRGYKGRGGADEQREEGKQKG
jgi:hypothetical protein